MSAGPEPFLVLANGILQPDVQGVADEGVADGHLVERLDGPGKMRQVVEVQVVPGIDAKPCLFRHAGGRGEGRGGAGRIRGEVLGIGARIEFDAVRSCCRRSADEVRFGGGEQARSDARIAECADDVGEQGGVGQGVPSRIRSQDARGIRHEGHLVGNRFEDQGHEVLRRVPLDVEFEVEIKASNPLIVGTLDQVLEEVAGKQVAAFERRCAQIPPSKDAKR